MRSIFLPVFFISFTVFLWPLVQEYKEISLLDFAYASLIFFVVVTIELLTLITGHSINALVNKYRAASFLAIFLEKATYLLAASILSINFYYFLLTLINTQLQTRQSIAIILIPFFYFILINKIRIKFALIFCSIFILISLLNLAFSFSTEQSIDKNKTFELNEYRHLFKLKEKIDKRNIYLLSFDSAVSPESLRMLYNNPRAEHIEFLRDSGFRILDTAFSAGHTTRTHFFNMLRLDEENLDYTLTFFTTRSINPSYTLFEKAGYKIQFLFRGNYMGTHTGTLDYFYPEKKFITLCDFIDDAYGIFACNSQVLFNIMHANFGTNITLNEFLKKILERIKVINSFPDQNWITIAHIISPGHTDNNFSYRNLKEKDKYISKMLKAYPDIKIMMSDIITQIHSVDDDPVIIFYSDHGAGLTRGLDYNEANPMYTPDEIYIDKRGILFAVYPYDFCEEKFEEGYETVDLITDMLECEIRE